jgi:hypothetical protein
MELTQYDYLKGELFVINKQTEDLTQKVKSFCQNKEYPLNVRWNLFIDSDFGEHEFYIPNFKTISIERLQDFERHYTIYSIDLIELYEDYISDKLYEDNQYTFKYSSEEYDNFIKNECDPLTNLFKEEILQLFIKSFEYDW